MGRVEYIKKYVIFDIEHFGKDIGLYLEINGFPPTLLWNPTKLFVKDFIKKANIYPACLVSGMFFDLYKYLYSMEWLDLVTNKKEVTKDERSNERSIEHEK